MQYFGGKVKILKELSLFLNQQLKPNQAFVDLFCGGCNIILSININRDRYANDSHIYLMAMWKALANGWKPPHNVTEEEYNYIKINKDKNKALTGFVGFGCGYSGKFFGGYARSKNDRNFATSAYRSINYKMRFMKGIIFSNNDYKDFPIPKDALIYCDIPYNNSTCYKGTSFNHDEFYEWVREQDNRVLISEYKENIPEDYKIVWEKESKQNIGSNKKTTEVLIEYTSNS